MNLRTWILALSVALLVAGLAAAGAAAAIVGYRFDITPGARCVGGYGVDGETVTVTLRDRDGTRLTRRSVEVSSDNGFFRACLGTVVSPGMTLILNGESGGHSAVVPRFDARVDRVTNVLTGHAPAGMDIQGSINQCVPRLCAPNSPLELTATPQGTFSLDLGTDIDGQEFVSLGFQTLGGDRILTRATAPYMVVRQPRATMVQLWPSRSGQVTVRLRAPGGTLRASVTRTVTRGRAAAVTFRRDGRDVRGRAGDRIVADFAGDVDMTVPALGLFFDVPGDSVSGQCFANEWYTVTTGPTLEDSTFTTGQAGSGGSFTMELAELQSGWAVEVLCQDARGDQLRNLGTVP